MLKTSQFTVAKDLAERGAADHVLVYNMFTGKSLTLRKGAWDSIQAAVQSDGPASPKMQEALQALAGMGVLVPEDRDEKASWSKSFDQVRLNPKRIFPLLAVTTACNIGCTYCYESGTVGETMSDEVVDGVLRWFERRLRVDGIKEIYPTLFGGEPLLFPDKLLRLMNGLNQLCQENEGRCHYSISSNGLLLTDDLAKQLVRKGLFQMQVSLDGPKGVHNVRRIGKKGQPSYDESLAGLFVAARHVQDVTLKINFDRQNRASISKLYADMEKEGLAGRVSVKLEAIAHQMPDSKVLHDPKHVMPPESTELADAYTELTIEAESRGFQVTKNTAHTTPCMFTSNHGVLLGPDGSIYKCISLVGRKEHRVGSVFDDDYDQEAYGKQMNVMKRLDECFEEKCPYVPVCGGGCAYESIVRTGRSDLRFCTKDNLDRFHYQRQLNDNRGQLEAIGVRPLEASELQPASDEVANSSGC